MIGLDTNIIIRYLVQDDPIQSPLATRVIEQECSELEPGFICHIVLCEVIWVLKTCYKTPTVNENHHECRNSPKPHRCYSENSKILQIPIQTSSIVHKVARHTPL